jgi:prolyl 4-hydroxylase
MNHIYIIAAALACICCSLCMFYLLYIGKPWELFRGSSSCSLPRIYPGFLSSNECNAIITAAETSGILKPSEVQRDTSVRSKVRTSHSGFLDDGHPASIMVKRKVAALTGLSQDLFENVQVVRYAEGQKYESHYDAMGRTDTVLCYLNDRFQGGETHFPNAKVTITPRRGMAVWWKNIDDRGNNLPCALHSSMPVLQGQKYACTVWIKKESREKT